MRRVLVTFLLAMTACQTARLPWSTTRRAASYRKTLQDSIEAAVARVDPQLHWGMSVVGATDGTVIYEHNSQQRFIPASTLKLFTAAAALHYLGPAHRFNTSLLTDEVDKYGRAKNLFLRGSGDPRLGVGDLATMAAMLKEQGINAVTGDLVVDDSVFDTVPYGRGWMWDDLGDGFSAPIGGVNVASNVVSFSFQPATRAGVPLRYAYAPPTNFITLQNSGQTGVAGSATTVRINALGTTPIDAPGLVSGQVVQIAGAIPVDGHTQWRRLSIRDPMTWAGVLMREQLKAAHIEVGGAIRRGFTPLDATLWTNHSSNELGASLAEFMKASDNQAMESLLKRIGQMTTLTPGSWTNGVAAVKAFLETIVGIETSTLVLSDGSGNSRYTLVAPTQIMAVLRSMHDNFSLAPEFLTTLPIGGTDGTLSGRMTDAKLLARVRAKTGTMTGVSNLAGYVYTADGDTLMFVILMDGYVGSADVYRRLQDEILRLLVTPV